MTTILTLLGLSGAMILLLVVFVRHTRVRFIIDLEGSAARVSRGDPPSAFVRACGDVARFHRISRGRILGVRTGNGIELQFSSDIPGRTQQSFRNVWIPPDSGGPGGGNRAAG
jgi:hypothetical protein